MVHKIWALQIVHDSISDLHKYNVNLKIDLRLLPQVAQNWLLQVLELLREHQVSPVRSQVRVFWFQDSFIPRSSALALCPALLSAEQKWQGSCSYGHYILVGGDRKETNRN